MPRFYQTPIWKIFIGTKGKNLRYFSFILMANFFSAIFEGSSFALIFFAFSSMEGRPLQDVTFYRALEQLHIANWLQSFPSNELFLIFVLAAVGLQALRSAVSYVACYAASVLSLKAQTDAQTQVYRQIFRFSFAFASQYKTGDLAEYAKTPSIAIPALLDGLNRFLVNVLMILGTLSMMFLISPTLTLVTALLFGFFALMQKMLVARVIHSSEQLTENLVEFSHQTIQSLQGIRPIHVFHRHGYIQAKISTCLTQIAAISKKVFLWNNFIPILNETINILLVGTILIIGSFILAKSPSAGLPSLLTYLALTYRLASRLQNAMGYLGAVAVHAGSLKRLNQILRTQDKEFMPVKGDLFTGLSSSIEFKNVSLTYSNISTAALQDLSFQIKRGAVTAFVGFSGAGKSSVLDVLLRLFEPTKGSVVVDSKDLRDYSLESWRERLGVVSQDTYVFNDTIEENIRFGFLGATHEEIINAAQAAGAHEFIAQMPQSYQTVVGERGYRLSGGERQRVALARALLRNPDILILDEATSSLDSHTERLIQEFLEKFHQNKTIVLVAHRLSTVMKADQIIVLENGQVIESGKHDDLIRKNGRYSYLWRLQSEEQKATVLV